MSYGVRPVAVRMRLTTLVLKAYYSPLPLERGGGEASRGLGVRSVVGRCVVQLRPVVGCVVVFVTALFYFKNTFSSTLSVAPT